MNEPRPGLYGLLARDAPSGVIFRRGPSKHVLLIAWNTRKDTFRAGQWLKGRIYERRCDLSPSGERLVYFAANHKPPYRSWTAVSRPPFLTAVALWPKGDTWGGGGLFEAESKLLLNHREGEGTPAEGLAPPRELRVEPFGLHPGWGEDDPIWSTRLARDGWRCLQEGTEAVAPTGPPRLVDYASPLVWSKARPGKGPAWELRSLVSGIGEQGGPWYVTSHALVSPDAGATIDLGDTDWADWAPDGDLVFSRGAALYRLRPGPRVGREDAVQIADFGALRFETCAPPKAARSWARPLPKERR